MNWSDIDNAVQAFENLLAVTKMEVQSAVQLVNALTGIKNAITTAKNLKESNNG